MKRTFTLLAALLFTIAATAQTRSKLSVSVAGNTPTRVMIDGKKYKVNGNELVVSNLKMGMHSVKIYQLKNGGRRMKNNGYPGNNNNNYQLVHNGNINIKPQYHVDIMINRFGKAFVDEEQMGQGYDDDDDDWGDNGDWDNNDNAYNVQVMSAQAFGQFKQTINNEPFEETKLKISKQFITTNYFTSAQVKELLQLFSFETSKLDLAKFAYKYTVDKGSYFVVNDAFSYSSSKEELMQYIQKNP